MSLVLIFTPISLVVTVYGVDFIDKAVRNTIGCLLGVAITIGISLFEANAIQFGVDQLLEAPTSNLISFIHWYYWSQNVAGLVVFYTYYLGYFAILEAYIMSMKFRVEEQFYR